jgi:hypothetical protein
VIVFASRARHTEHDDRDSDRCEAAGHCNAGAFQEDSRRMGIVVVPPPKKATGT